MVFNKHTLILFIISFFCRSDLAFAQEIIANVIIESEQLQTQEKQIFQDMKLSIQQFLNNRKWTNDKFGIVEKIKVNINIRLTESPTTGVYKATAQIQSARPVYGVGYESLVLSFVDKDFNFAYTQSQPMEYNDNVYTNNLTQMLAFYVYVILGMDYDSFSKNAGTDYFEKAFQTLNVAQPGSDDEAKGWKQFGTNPNSRYWLIENLISPQFKDFRESTYTYYRLGMDKMSSSVEDARKKIMEALQAVKRSHDVKPNSCMIRTYFNTKDREYISIFSEATPTEKTQAVELLKTMDPTNTDQYELLLK